MRGSREAPNWVWRARRGRWAKVSLSGSRGMSAATLRARDGLAGSFADGSRLLDETHRMRTRGSQPRRGAEGVTGGEVEPSGGRQISTPARVLPRRGYLRFRPGGRNLTPCWCTRQRLAPSMPPSPPLLPRSSRGLVALSGAFTERTDGTSLLGVLGRGPWVKTLGSGPLGQGPGSQDP